MSHQPPPQTSPRTSSDGYGVLPSDALQPPQDPPDQAALPPA
eukprot:CAMPEP_0114143502 /NCGR_PEP_ID=MMETSP0043_2-20121206/19020_1 /TAXON_ID=464988 /ORGANISM="Hemiselmis andersenii, Strain CCMP644" /LENGTH=41 /DNA_ID= /DNA_START= /DNA_END= /DNA_ORIENTATION=